MMAQARDPSAGDMMAGTENEPQTEGEPGTPLTKISRFKDVLAGELLVRGYWTVANIVGSISWPVTVERLVYRGVELFLLPVTQDCHPGVAMRSETDDYLGAQRAILTFLSALSWVKSASIHVDSWSGGNLPRPMGLGGKRPQMSIDPNFDVTYLPEPDDPKARLALALFREGRALNHPGYAFIAFYRILEIAIPGSPAQMAWINENLDRVEGWKSKELVAALRAEHADVGRHLYAARRSAAAHAGGSPVLDPDDPSQLRDFYRELPLMTDLAALLIESRLGIKTDMTVFREHLYELDGFRRILGDEIVSSAASGTAPDGQMIDIPHITVGLRQRKPYPALGNLKPLFVGLDGNRVRLVFGSENGLIHFHCACDFATERLVFEIFSDLEVGDDGSPDAARGIADVARFNRDYLGNGRLQITDAVTGKIISRKDAYIPHNFMVDDDACNAEIDRWLAEADRRANEQALKTVEG